MKIKSLQEARRLLKEITYPSTISVHISYQERLEKKRKEAGCWETPTLKTTEG